jgi:hypothetical protein
MNKHIEGYKDVGGVIPGGCFENAKQTGLH